MLLRQESIIWIADDTHSGDWGVFHCLKWRWNEIAALIDKKQKSEGRGIKSKFKIYKCLYRLMVMIFHYAIHVGCRAVYCT